MTNINSPDSTQLQQSVLISQFINLLIHLYGYNLTPTRLKQTSCGFKEHDGLLIATSDEGILYVNNVSGGSPVVSGDAIKQIMHVKGLGFKEALEYLANFIGQPLDNPTPIKRQNKPKYKPKCTLRKGFTKEGLAYWNETKIQGKATAKFLQKNGIFQLESKTYMKDGEERTWQYRNEVAFLITDTPSDPLNGKNKIRTPESTTHKYTTLFEEGETYIYNLANLPNKGDLLLITAGTPDTLAINYHYGKDDTYAICAASEGDDIGTTVASDLKERFNDVVLLLDNDEKGKESSLKFSAKYDIPYCDISQHTEENDICDILKKHGKAFLDDLIISELEAKRKAPQEQPKAPLSIVHSETEKTAVPDFPINVLPNRIQNIVEDVAEGLKVPNELLCTSILTACSAAIGNSLHTKVLNYVEPASLYMAIVAGTGVGKSPAIEFACKPLDEIDDMHEMEYIKAKKDYEDIMSMTKSERKTEGIETPEIPKYITYIVKDATPEALADVMSQNKRGILNCQDELTTLINNFNRYNKGSEEEMWLSMWNQSKVKINRTGNKFTTIRMPFVSILGGTQPSKVKDFFAKDRSQTGFTNRILFCHTNRTKIPYPSKHIIPPQAAQEYKQIIHNLINTPTTEDENGNIQGGLLAFTKKAESIYYDKICTIVDMQNESTDLLKGAIEKMKRYIPRFALILQALEFATEENKQITYVQEKAINGAFELFYYFLENFKKAVQETKGTDKQNVIIGSDNETPEAHAMRLLLQGMSIREVMQNTGLKKWKIQKIKKSVS